MGAPSQNAQDLLQALVQYPDLPNVFICPITQQLMADPVMAVDGHTYDRDAIRRWFNDGHRISPVTNVVLDSTRQLPNFALRSQIIETAEAVVSI